MDSIDLGGEWQARQKRGDITTSGMVPGCIHTDLLAAGLIADPFERENELDVQWVSEADWLYERQFDVSESLRCRDQVLLICEGLDTFATIGINGRRVAKTDNQFRTWTFDAKPFLQAGENHITIQFDSPLPYQEKQNRKRALRSPQSAPHEVSGRSYVRKSPCNYGWDWGPCLPTCGISRPIRIVAFDTARLGDIHIQQHHKARSVELDVAVLCEKTGRAALSAQITVSLNSNAVATADVSIKGQGARVALRIDNPSLWWPNGMGEQPLYNVEVTLLDKDGNRVDSSSRRIGLRTLGLRRRKDQWGESFEFIANGVPFFAKGANWIPADQFPTRLTRGQYEDLLHSTVDANMNMLRVWGGGIYEHDIFYDLCDELGICIWQDFMFACASYPASDEAFMASVRAEAEDNVRRIRHHACLALWCGNNELEQFIIQSGSMPMDQYKALFDRLLPSVVKKFDPQRDYWPSSPHSPHGDRLDHKNPKWGDAHLWDVWHGRQPFEWYRSAFQRFTSEFGFQSFPEPATVEGYTKPSDRNVTSPVMEHHQRSRIGNTVIMQYMLDWFRMPADFETTLWVSQILQGLGIKYAVEHWRRNMPRCMGALYWQLNDTWPVASWASIDYHGRWKALHFAAKDFFAPALVSGVENNDKGTIEVHVTNDHGEVLNGIVRHVVTNVSGRTLEKGENEVAVPRRSSKRVQTLNLMKVLRNTSSRDVMVWLELVVDGAVVSRNLVAFEKPKKLDLQDPEIATTVKKHKDGSFTVTLKAQKPALYAWLDVKGADARFSNNFVHLRPKQAVRIELKPARPIALEELKKRLRVRSLRDTYTVS